jgi:hypothetical protein
VNGVGPIPEAKNQMTRLANILGQAPSGMAAVMQSNLQLIANRLHGQVAVPYAAVIDLDLGDERTRIIDLAGDIELTASGHIVGDVVRVLLRCDGSPRALTFPAGWLWAGGVAPSSLAANKSAVLEITTFRNTSAPGSAPTDNDVAGEWSVEP